MAPHDYYIVVTNFGRGPTSRIAENRDSIIGWLRQSNLAEVEPIAFIHYILIGDDGGGTVMDVTNSILKESGFDGI